MTFLTMSADEQKTHFRGLSNDDLTRARSEVNSRSKTLFGLEAPTPDEVDEAASLTAASKVLTAEEKRRSGAAKRFAAAKAEFSVNDGVEDSDEDEEGSEEESTEDEGEEGDEGDDDDDESDEESDEDEGDEVDETVEAKANPFEKKGAKDTDSEDDDSEDDEKKDEKKKRPEVQTASASLKNLGKATSRRAAAAKSNKRPAKAASSSPVIITASQDVPGHATGSRLDTGSNGDTMRTLASALHARAKGFAPFNLRAAQALISSRGGDASPVLNKVGLASIGLQMDDVVTASGNEDQHYSALEVANKRHLAALTAAMDGTKDKEALVAAGFCAPSEVSYNWLADYVVDGLLSLPEVSAPRGGLMFTTGPALAQGTYLDTDNFGFHLTEAEMEAGVLKTCEVIECPEFEDHRLEAFGYCWKVPIMTNKFYPEILADALRLTTVLYAHKVNKARIEDLLALSTTNTMGGYGGTFHDTLEMVTQIGVRERRYWNLGQNAIIEMKFPVYAKEVFRADVSRRLNLPTGTPVTDEMLNAEFAVRKITVEYLNDWRDLHDLAGNATAAVWPDDIPFMMYPAGTFNTAVEDVISLQAVHDAASLVKNEYTGVFYEQAIMNFKRGYRSIKGVIPINTAGIVGRPVIDGGVAPTAAVTTP